MALSAIGQQCYISLQAYLGYPDYSHVTAIDYSSAASNPTLTAAAQSSTPVSVAANTTDQSFNLATLFPALTGLVFISLVDITGTPQPFSFGTAAGTGRQSVAAGAWAAWMPNGGAPPTIFLTNPSTTTASNILISVLSN
jgi:hypothetical protein